MISVVIPTYNRARMLARVLPSYLISSSVLEVLVVDDGSEDETKETVEAFSKHDPRVRLVQHAANLGMTYARNTGLERVQGDLVLMSEDDLAVAPGSLETLLAHMQETGADVIAGRRIWMRLGESESAALRRANARNWPVVNRRLLEHYSSARTDSDVEAPLVDSTMLIRRHVLDHVKYANCYPGNSWREESDFQIAAQEKGFKVVFCPHALFFHYDRPMAGRGSSRFLSDVSYLYWIYRNNLTFLRRHRNYLERKIPESLILGSIHITSLIYIIYRAALLVQTEVRRAWLTKKLGNMQR